MKKKVLHIVPQFTTGGAEKMVLYYGQLLNPSQYDVLAACAVETGELESQFADAGVETFVSSRLRDGGRIGAYIRLLKFVRTWKPDIVHTHLFGGDLMGWIIRVLVYRKARWVVTLHNVEHHTSIVRKAVWLVLLAFAHRVITVSPSVDQYAKTRFLVPNHKRRCIINGIPLSPWYDLQPTHMPTSTPIQFATIGRLTEQKGHTYLLDALALVDSNIDWQLHIYGTGELLDALQQQSKRLGLSDRTLFHGVQSDISTKLRTVDIVIQPSLWEGLSLVIMESMAAGKCIITTPPGGGGIIQDTVHGRIVPIQNVPLLAEAIASVCTDTAHTEAMAVAAKKYALSHFDMKTNVMAVADVYKELCQ